MAPRSLMLAGSMLLVLGCLPPQTPPVCEGADCQPPAACDTLDETGCLARADCQASYAEVADRCAGAYDDGTRCGGYGQVFMGCTVKACAPVTCDLYCAHGMARDENGCDVCACAPALCSSDAECMPGEACLFPATYCEAGTYCAQSLGVCTVVEDPGCSSDAECRAGERCVFPMVDCPPNAFCAPPRGSCKPEGSCTSDADCGVGRRCELMDSCMAIGCPAPSGACVDRTPCTDGSQCGWGETCAMDPNDPCTIELCYTFAPVQTYCVPTCEMLGEADCLARRDCEAMYEGPRCGNDPTPAHFVGCKPAACPPVACGLWCANGYKVDANGCNLCECNGCQTDAECAPGERCEVAVYDACPPGEACPPLYGTCVPAPVGCESDADCATGETCVFTLTNCGGGSSEGGGTGGCMGPSTGVCVKTTVGCTDDSQCPAGQFCSFPEIICVPGGECPAVEGVCVAIPPPSGCTDDSQCGPGERCDYNPMLNCGGATNCIGSCIPAECRSDADCRAGESCIFLMVACDPADPACPNVGICNAVPRTCGSDADCRANEECTMVDCAPNMDCMQQAVCTARPECRTDADCGLGETCQPDPTDPCNQPNVDCFAPGRNICL